MKVKEEENRVVNCSDIMKIAVRIMKFIHIIMFERIFVKFDYKLGFITLKGIVGIHRNSYNLSTNFIAKVVDINL